jgi:23S rRNA pseudouridine1911/1915/1917 synthase
MGAASRARSFRIPPELARQRLDKVITELAPDLSRSAAQRLLKDGHVRLEGLAARAADKAVAGQLLTIEPPSPRPLALAAESIPLDIAFEDDVLLVVNKPPGMVVHPAHGHHSGTLVNALLAHCRLSSGSDQVRPGIVHRLDQDTSGLLLVAKQDSVHARLSRLVEDKAVSRRYLALVWGAPAPSRGRISTTLGRHPQHRTMMAVLAEGRGRIAITDYELLESYAWHFQDSATGRPREREAAAVRCVLQTGRTHQIRVHLAHRGHPLLGDPVYGDAIRDGSGPEGFHEALSGLPGQALHAAELAFSHPVTGERVEVAAPPPPGFAALLEWLRNRRA